MLLLLTRRLGEETKRRFRGSGELAAMGDAEPTGEVDFETFETEGGVAGPCSSLIL